jgi:hypothetical protein
MIATTITTATSFHPSPAISQSPDKLSTATW